jgi:hypothetical protein
MSGVLPRGACDCHCHVFGPAARFPYSEPRSYTPNDAPLEAYLAMLDRLGFERGVLVQPSAYGRDNRAMLDALAREPKRLRGVAVGGAELTQDTLKQWHAAGVRGLRANEFRRDGKPYYQNGVGLKEIEPLLPVIADLGWHLQLWIDARDLPEMAGALARVPVPVVVDHMGRLEIITAHTILASRRCCAASAKAGFERNCPAPTGWARRRPTIRRPSRSTTRWSPPIRRTWSGAPTGRIRGRKDRNRRPRAFWPYFSTGRAIRLSGRRSSPTIRRGCTIFRGREPRLPQAEAANGGSSSLRRGSGP